MADWFVGQKVVCVDDDVVTFLVVSGKLTKGAVYTIREIVSEGAIFGFRLNEVVRARMSDGREMAFAHWYFRSVVIPEADISALEAILREVNQREPVEA